MIHIIWTCAWKQTWFVHIITSMLTIQRSVHDFYRYLWTVQKSRQHDWKCRLKSSQVKSVYFNHPWQGNSTNCYLILGPRDKAAPPTNQQIKTIPPKRVKNLATPSSICICISSSSTGDLRSQPIRGNVRRTGRMFLEHVERNFLDPEYSFVAVRRILPTRLANKHSPN